MMIHGVFGEYFVFNCASKDSYYRSYVTSKGEFAIKSEMNDLENIVHLASPIYFATLFRIF